MSDKFGARGVLAWAFEVAGARAASSVMSELRLDLVERRLRDQPLALDGVDAAEIATTIRFGSSGLIRIVCRQRPPAPGCQFSPVS